MKVLIILRLIVKVALCCGVFIETGILTTAAIAFVFIESESPLEHLHSYFAKQMGKMIPIG